MAARRYLTTNPTADDAVARLARQVADVERELGTLERLREDVAAHARAITRLADALHRTTTSPLAVPPAPRTADGHPDGPGDPNGAGGSGASSGGNGDGPGTGGSDGADGAEAPGEEPAPAWLTVTDPQVAVRWLSALAVWVPAVWQPYQQTKTPGCWPWHPPVVAELLVVQHLWNEAIVDDAGPAPLAAWHDRWRPGAMTRVARLMAGCERAHGRHKNDKARPHFYDTAYLDEVAHWWATTHGINPSQPAPGLTLDTDNR